MFIKREGLKEIHFLDINFGSYSSSAFFFSFLCLKESFYFFFFLPLTGPFYEKCLVKPGIDELKIEFCFFMIIEKAYRLNKLDLFAFFWSLKNLESWKKPTHTSTIPLTYMLTLPITKISSGTNLGRHSYFCS